MPERQAVAEPAPATSPPRVVRLRRRRVRIPVILFILTCVSTFWVGATVEPNQYIQRSLEQGSLMPVRQVIIAHYPDALRYMVAVLGILLAHEMGHFLATVWYGVPATLPYFLPMPVSPIGTFGAVIVLDGAAADRKQIFDIGIAGPLAGLVVAIPVLWYGVTQLHVHTENGDGTIQLQMPLGMAVMLQAAGADWASVRHGYWLGQLQGNPYILAGWVGFLITGLNMLPVGQLDGGHVTYCLFGRYAHWIARAFMVTVITYSAAMLLTRQVPTWILMAILLLLVGTDHPPTRDDSVPIGPFRTMLGFVSLTIPILCMPLELYLR